MKPVRTWVLIADANSARILENSGPGKGLFQLEDKTFAVEEKPDHSDTQGRVFHSVSPARHKMEPNISRDITLTNHVDEIFSSLEKSFDSHEFERLIICAPPRTLGVMRERISDNLRAIISAEIPKDLTHIPTDNLSSHFSDVLAV